MAGSYHVPILMDECIGGLDIKPYGVYVDATLGGGGHSLEIAKRLSPAGKLFGIDRDMEAVRSAENRLSAYSDRFIAIQSNFSELKTTLLQHGVTSIDGILFDFGVSSHQLDDASRGFSHNADAPLDMRMDRSETMTAKDIVNRWDEEELRKIFFEYGEERYSARIASAIVRRRQNATIETTGQLVEIVKAALPAAAKREEQHPAKRIFQAVRIAVNGELAAIETALPNAVRLLNLGGRIAVLSFHSLEDRLVKNTFSAFAKGCTCPPDFPVCICGKKPVLRLVNKKPTIADNRELGINPRARSAKLRIAEKICGAADRDGLG